ncbi:Six-hairpin glycosidase-like protein [Ilyonectria robusta]|uniref:Six-hairpin glycosidase-like protein n=1 Tax=Ilyonectria robusta TaxID=1079257 RepID=UPI001E8E8F0C|nr:Six-hairpin glycosidase-like protein [Ilyonectria robusta]KAH8680488.1 Six-hairpin glycosidase-like protein [Ilyonectria robusta]
MRIHILNSALLVCLLSSSGQTFETGPQNTDRGSRQTHFHPVGLALGSQPSINGGTFHQFSLNQSVPFATLDYGVEVAGYPSFEIKSVSGPVQIEVKYSEEASGLSQNFSDGPFPYAVALANTYRVETFEITRPGRIDAFLLQGGQRWQSIKLITKGSVTFKSVGFTASVPVVDVDDLPGSFLCDDEVLNEIWKLGARAASMSCVESGSQKTMWEIDRKNGAFVRGMRSGITALGAFFENYTLEFDTKVDKGGIGWTVAFPLASPAQGIQLNLVADNQPYANANKTLMRPNSILFGYGYSFVNVTTLPSWHLDTFKVPFSVKDNKWYRVKTVLNGKSISVSIDNVEIFDVPLSSYPVGSSRFPSGIIPSKGSFGFGGWQDQAGYFKNVVAYDTANKTEIYRNPLTDASEDGVVREYGVRANYKGACLDGPKRDRLIWLGDFLHTVRVIGASTSRFDLARETLQTLLDWQTSSGLLPYAPPLGYDPVEASYAFARGGASYFMGQEVYGIILPDYQILGILSFTEYVRMTNDLKFAKKTWSQWRSNLQYLTSNIAYKTTGLLSLPGAFLGPSHEGSAINCALLQALSQMADVATAINEKSDANNYRGLARNLTLAVNDHLWNEKRGSYSTSTTDSDGVSVNSIAFCITSGASSRVKAARLLASLEGLELHPGYKDSTASDSSDPDVNISPNTNGFLLSALLVQDSAAAATTSMSLIKSLWTPMISNKETSTGASWEYVGQTGNPGLGLFTSLSHPWGGAPTYILTRAVAGIQQAEGVDGFGYKNWVISPQMGLHMGLKRATAKVLTAFGTLEVKWQLSGGVLKVTIRAPSKTRGVFKLGNTIKRLSGRDYYSFTAKL